MRGLPRGLRGLGRREHDHRQVLDLRHPERLHLACGPRLGALGTRSRFQGCRASRALEMLSAGGAGQRPGQHGDVDVQGVCSPRCPPPPPPGWLGGALAGLSAAPWECVALSAWPHTHADLDRRALGAGAGRARTRLCQHLLARLGRQRAHKAVDAQRARRRVARRRHRARALANVVLARPPPPRSGGLTHAGHRRMQRPRRRRTRRCARVRAGRRASHNAKQRARSRHCPACQNSSSTASAHACDGTARACSAPGRCRPGRAAQGTSRSVF